MHWSDYDYPDKNHCGDRSCCGPFENEENSMSTDPKDGGPTTESREEKRVEVAPAPPEPTKETVTETTTVERES